MKTLAISCVATVLFVGMVGSASAAERAISIPASTLTSMGLGGAHQMSDNAGLAIRGMGDFGTSASVWGESTATKGDNTSTNGYKAASTHHRGEASASGKNLSFAGSASGTLTNVHFHVNVAGGFSSAMAK
jgi:hypothetical protein